ncbi:MAG: hypothetical protein ACLPXB_06280 [Thiobacillaceae bacterium]
MMQPLKDQWRGWAMRIDALSFRERVLVLIALTGAMCSVMYLALIEPALKSQEEMVSNASSLQRDADLLRQRLAEAERDNNNGKIKEVDQLRAQATRLEQSIKQRERAMVAPDKMIGVLKDLLASQPGLTLVSLHTQEPQPVLEETPDSVTAASGTATPASAQPPDQRYRHGVEIRVQGSYAHLTDYVRRLEHLPWAMQWDSMRLDASHYPQLELTLGLATLSRESTWAKL